MAHKEQIEFVELVKEEFKEHFTNCRVTEVGSLDINGSVRCLFVNCDYIGIDIAPGKGVDVVAKCHEANFLDESFDTIITCEALEHDMYFEETVKNIVRMLKKNGLFVMTCAGINRAEHGTRRTETISSPLTAQIEGWKDFYQNRTEQDFFNIPEFSQMNGVFFNERGGQDLYYCGVKK